MCVCVCVCVCVCCVCVCVCVCVLQYTLTAKNCMGKTTQLQMTDLMSEIRHFVTCGSEKLKIVESILSLLYKLFLYIFRFISLYI